MPRIDLPKDNALDKAIAYINPQLAIERRKARAVMAAQEAYTGASKRRKGIKGLGGGNGSADSDLHGSLETLRERSRQLCRNNALSVGAVNTKVTNVVGSGLKLQSQLSQNADWLGISQDQAEFLEEQIEREWALWAGTSACDIENDSNFNDLCSLIYRQVLENGDAFVMFTRTNRVNTPYSLRLQVIEADQVSTPDNTNETMKLSLGVERNANFEKVAYHVQEFHPDNIEHKRPEWRRVPAFNSIGQPNIIHLFAKLRAGQSRGVPMLSPVMEALNQLGDYTESELQAAIISSIFTVAVKTEDGQGLSVPDQHGSTNYRDGEQELGSGSIINLAQGEDVSIISGNRPNQMYDAFITAILRQIGAALEIPFEVLIKHFTASYSASRAALVEAWKHFMNCRRWLAAHLCQVVYERWLYEAVVSGRVAIPSYLNLDPVYQQAYAAAEWIGPARGQINELQETNAAKARMEAGISTLERETAEINGGDYLANLKQIKKERAALLESGLLVEVQPVANMV
jgi:lambda family phage portal protein